MVCPYEAASALADAVDTPSLREALTTFERLGAVAMAEAVAARLRSRGVRVAARRPPAGATAPTAAGLSGRECEVLKLVAAGFTNPQIASALHISRKTAEHTCRASGLLALVGVEYVVFKDAWDAAHSAPPELFGQPFNVVRIPNRYGLPEFYELHAWAWKANPIGAHQDRNPKVLCPNTEGHTH